MSSVASSQDTLYIIRHGDRHDFATPTWKEEVSRAGGTPHDPPLSALGHEQARETAEGIFRSITDVDMILASPYLRTIQTAVPFSEVFGKPISIECGLGEVWYCQGMLPTPKERFSYFPQVDFDRESWFEPQTLTSQPACTHGSKYSGDDQRRVEAYPDEYFLRMVNFANIVNEKVTGGKKILMFTHAASTALVAALLKCKQLSDIPHDAMSTKAGSRSDLFAPCGIYKLVRDRDSGEWQLEQNGGTNDHLANRHPGTYPWGHKADPSAVFARLQERRDYIKPLNNGLPMPTIGFGTYQRSTDMSAVKEAVLNALKVGYRHIDCASFYKNEKIVGEAIRESGIPRKELFITGKVWNDFQGYERCKSSFDRSLQDLGIGYFDLFLVHWPFPGMHAETYRALEDLQAEGLLKSVGVSNYTIDDYKELQKTMRIKPVCNQIEVNPVLYRKGTIDFFHSQGVRIAAYKPLGATKALKNPIVQRLAEKYKVSAGQLCIRWGFQHDMVVIPKSNNVGRMTENFNIFNFHIDPADMHELDSITTAAQEETFYQHFLSRRSQDPPPIFLNDGKIVPRLGFGTYQRSTDMSAVKEAVLNALKVGYRHIDCASFYKNEKIVGEAIRESGIPRKELFITGKVWNDFQGYERCKSSFDRSLQDLGIGYFDLFLVHWPFPGMHAETYRALEDLQAEGLLKSVGVSNYTIDDYKELQKTMRIKPVCNQIEVNPVLYRKGTIDFFHSQGVRIAAYKPLGATKALKNPIVQRLAEKYKVSAGQLCIRWGFQHDMVVIPKSNNVGRMTENFNIFNFHIDPADMHELDSITTAAQEETFYTHYLSRRSQDPPPVKRVRTE